MRPLCGWRLPFRLIVAAIMVGAGLNGLAFRPCGAAVPVFTRTWAPFWRNSAVAVVKITAASAQQRKPRQFKNPLIGTFHGPVQIHVLAVLATQKTVKTVMHLDVYSSAGDCYLQGPISAYASGTFLVCMTFDQHRQRWCLTGSLGAPFMPKGLESASVAGVSDPLVKKVAAKIKKLIAHTSR